MRAELAQAGYDRAALRPRILHLGFGAFARAHLMVYLDSGLAVEGGDWGVVAVRLNTGAEALTALDSAAGQYHVLQADNTRLTIRKIGAVIATCHPGRDGIGALLARFADPDLSLVTLTITEKGYCVGDGRLNMDHAGIKADLETPDTPGTAIGVLVRGLAARLRAGLGGITILSCDNLPENGHLIRAAVTDFARSCDPDLAVWIEQHVTFPGSMVDRIVPAMTPEGHALISDALGAPDPNAIVCEPFRQWVIEDDFAAGTPPFAAGGAQLVQDVRPFEEMKLRMLNGAHSFLACLGALAGQDTIADCMDQPVLKRAAHGLMMGEQVPTLSSLPGVDLAGYADALIARFQNRRLNHRTTQIATDGSQKIPQRILAPITWHLRHGSDFPLLALGVAGWMLYAGGADEAGNDLPLNDPLAETLRMAARSDDPVAAFLAIRAVFPAPLAMDPIFETTLRDAYERLSKQGVIAVLSGMDARQ
ncbi:MAG: mannitol dehydrogenase family protein [Marinosulfonomonas sp.]|nr:mannitol dehydrogenase family protein [Marinosulfonomonas sp.]